MQAIILQLFHEANAFLPTRVSAADFQRRYSLEGDVVRSRLGASRNWLGGVLSALDDARIDTHIGLCTAAHPGGMVDAASYADISAALLASLDTALNAALADGPVQLVVLLLHGALAVEGQDDPEGTLSTAVRRRLAPDTLLACGLDFHANPGDALLAAADIVIGGVRYPHDDTWERGRRLVEIALRSRQDGLHSWHFRLPLAVPMPSQNTLDGGAFADLVAHCRRKQDTTLLDVAMLGGFPYADSDRACTSVLITGTDSERAVQTFREIADLVWQRREPLLASFPGPQQLPAILNNAPPGGTLVVADVGDNPGAGGAGDDGALFDVLLHHPGDFAAGILIAPHVVVQAAAAGLGASMSLSLSATRLALPLQPMTATVHRLGPLHYRNQGPMMTNELVDGGPATVLHLSRPGQPGHGELLVASERIQAYDRAAFDSQGIDLGIKRVILIKTSAHFRASYTALASAGIVLADSGGWASPDMRSFAHANRQRPTLPLQVLDLRQWERAIEQEVERQ